MCAHILKFTLKPFSKAANFETARARTIAFEIGCFRKQLEPDILKVRENFWLLGIFLRRDLLSDGTTKIGLTL